MQAQYTRLQLLANSPQRLNLILAKVSGKTPTDVNVKFHCSDC